MNQVRLKMILITIVSLLSASFANARVIAPSIINLKSCDLEIRADQTTYHDGFISYFGNVEFIYGLANVKMHSVDLVKKKDGSCQLVAQAWNGKSGS